MSTTLHCGNEMKDYHWSQIEQAAREPQPEHRTRRVEFDPNHWRGRVDVPADTMERIARAFSMLDAGATFSTNDGFVAELVLPNADFARWSKNVHDGLRVMHVVCRVLSPGWAQRVWLTKLKEILVQLWAAEGFDGDHLLHDEPF